MHETGRRIAENCERPSEAPDDSCGGAVIVLRDAEIVGVHVVALEAPGKILEPQFVIESAAYIDEKRIVDEASRVEMTNASHGIHEGTQLADIGGVARPGDYVVLGYAAGSIKAAAIKHK